MSAPMRAGRRSVARVKFQSGWAAVKASTSSLRAGKLRDGNLPQAGHFAGLDAQSRRGGDADLSAVSCAAPAARNGASAICAGKVLRACSNCTSRLARPQHAAGKGDAQFALAHLPILHALARARAATTKLVGGVNSTA